VARSTTDQIVGQMTDATIRLVDANLELFTRLTGGTRDEVQQEEDGGTAQDIWLTCTESVGELVQLSYLTAQLVDSMWGRGRPSNTT
jgi:hypothetical protein